MLDRDSPIPLYSQLAADIQARIDRGEFNQTGRIPTEQQLTDEYAVSRITVRQAIANLVESNVVIRKQGKGTFFTRSRIEQNLESLHSLGEVFSQTGIASDIKILDIQADFKAPDSIRRKLQLTDDDQIALIKRQHLVEGVPVVCAYIYLSGIFCDHVLGEDLQKHSIYDLLEKKSNIEIAVARQEITALAADAEMTRVLHVPQGGPLLCMENITFTDEGTPIDNTFFYCHPDRYIFVATVRRTKTQTALAALDPETGQVLKPV